MSSYEPVNERTLCSSMSVSISYIYNRGYNFAPSN